MGIDQAVPDASLRREVDDPVDTPAAERALECGRLGQVTPHEIVVGAGRVRLGLQHLEPPLLERHVVVVVDGIDADHLVATLQKPPDQMEADETGVPGNQNSHAKPLLTASRRPPCASP